jgi:hypothetical protein
MRLIILIFLITSGAYAQNSSFSIKGGLNYSTLEYGGYDNNNITSETSYNLGGVLYLSWEKRDIIVNNTYLNIDFGINQKGVHNKVYNDYSDIDDVETNTDRSFLTTELPIILGYTFFNKLSIYVGSYLSLGFYTSTNNASKFFFIFTDDYSGRIVIDAGLMFGLEYELNNILFNFRFQQGFTELYPPNARNGLTNYYANSRQFVLMVGYRF